MNKGKGTPEVKEFYDKTGWHTAGDRPVDTQLFGVREDGPIRVSLHENLTNRIARALAPEGRVGSLLELGCGGNPAVEFAALAKHYHGVDFSSQGLAVAATRLSTAGVDFSLAEADITALPFDDDSFDAVYSSHVLYHIDNKAGQEAALSEALRVLRPGGTAVMLLANPFPLLFPVRLARRLLATALRQRGSGPLPYLPLRPAWFASRARAMGCVKLETAGIASTWFNQNVSEFGFTGRQLWRGLAHVQTALPKAAIYLGNYFMLAVTKRETAGEHQ